MSCFLLGSKINVGDGTMKGLVVPHCGLGHSFDWCSSQNTPNIQSVVSLIQRWQNQQNQTMRSVLCRHSFTQPTQNVWIHEATDKGKGNVLEQSFY